MSNLTDGKRALSAGDFEVAEKKLFKALDYHPDDGELWWAVMLCKYGFRNDGELIESVKADFSECARSGKKPPQTPFDSTYCKNALSYEKGTRRREFVEKLNAELSELWQQERGTSLKLSAPRPKRKAVGKVEIMRGFMFAAMALLAVGGIIGVYSIYAESRWAMYVGFILFIVCAIAAAGLRLAVKRAGGDVRYTLLIIVVIFAFTCVAVLVGGWMMDSKATMYIAGAAVVIIVLFAGIEQFNNRKDDNKKRKRKSRGRGESKSDYDRSRVTYEPKNSKNDVTHESKTSENKTSENDKKDKSNKESKNEEFQDVYD